MVSQKTINSRLRRQVKQLQSELKWRTEFVTLPNDKQPDGERPVAVPIKELFRRLDILTEAIKTERVAVLVDRCKKADELVAALKARSGLKGRKRVQDALEAMEATV